jgi:hypothetical protein
MSRRLHLYDIHINGTVTEIEPGLWRAVTDLYVLTAAAGGGAVDEALNRAQADYTAYPQERQADLVKKLRGQPVQPKVRPGKGDGQEFSVSTVVAA